MRDGEPNFDLFEGDEEGSEEPRTSPDTSADVASHSDEGDPPGGPGDPRGDLSVAPDETASGPDAGQTLEEPAADTAREEPAVWTISQVNQAVRALLEESLPPLWVSGEVANWTRARSGHCYFTLKDEEAQLRCVMWRGEASRLPTDPDEGMTVRAFGALTLYEARGEFQLVVRVLEGEGAEGLWRLAFEKLRKKLDGEGLLAPERKRPIPARPDVVGVVTSTTGAALRDILTVIRRRAPWVRVIVRGARVQGEGAAEEIAGSLRALGGSGLAQVIIVGRGGGSVEDLWAFNEEPVARAIAECPIPVISAVGHEVDVTISDLVADLRAATPSAAAEAAVPDRVTLLEGLREAPGRLGRSLLAAAGKRSGDLRRWFDRLTRTTTQMLKPRRQRTEELQERLVRGIGRGIEVRRHRLVQVVGKIDALSPLSTLQRGYAVPLGAEGQVLRRAGEFRKGSRFTLRVVDGRIVCETVESTTEEGFGG